MITAKHDLFRVGKLLPLVLAVLGFPILFFLGAHLTLVQLNELDPYVYHGYTLDYQDTLTRFGPTYYSTRIAFIFPERIFAYLFGQEPGYFALRFAALAAAAGSTYAIATRYFSASVAILACAWLCLLPWLGRSLLTTHYTVIPTVYLLMGIAFALVPRRWRAGGHIMAGIMFALAVNCNLLVLSVVGSFMPAWAYLQEQRRFLSLVRGALTIGVGFLLCYLCLIVFMRINYPVFGWFFESSTLREALSLSNGGGAIWHIPLYQIAASPNYLYLSVPVVYVVIAIVLAFANSTKPNGEASADCNSHKLAVATVLYLGTVILLALGLEIGMKFEWLRWYFYDIYFLPACLLALLAIAGTAESRLAPGAFQIAVFVNVALLCLIWLTPPAVIAIHSYLVEFRVYFVVMAGALVAMAFWNRFPAVCVVLVTGAVLMATSILTDSQYEMIAATPAGRKQAEWDVYRGTDVLEKFVTANLAPNQAVGFWYRNHEAPGELDSLQSTFLWGYSRLVAPAHGGHGMPVIDQPFIEAASTYPFIVLLALSTEEVEAGIAALRKAGFQYREKARTRFQGKVWGYTAALGALKPLPAPVGPLLFNVPLSDLRSANGGSLAADAEGFDLTTAVPQWCYSFSEPLVPDGRPADGPAIVRFRLKVDDGSVGIAVSRRGNMSDLIKEMDVNRSDDPQVVDVDIPDLNEADAIIVRNASPAGASHAILQSIDVYRPNR